MRQPTVLSVFDLEPRFIGGVETYARELSLQLGRFGWQSALSFSTPPAKDVRHFLDLPNVSLGQVDFVNRGTAGILWQLGHLLRDRRPRIVHFHFTGFISPYPWLARLLSARDVFFTARTSRPPGYSVERAPLPKTLLARAINWPLSRVICVSHYGYRCLTERDLLPARRFAMVYNGVDLQRVGKTAERAAAFLRRFAIPAERKVVAQVSWIIPEKGVLDLLTAARLVAARTADVHFVIVGDGPFREEYMRQADAWGLGGRGTWTRLVEDPFAAGVYDAADVVCQVSRWEEVFGSVIAEAMACRKPVIATRVGGIPELVADRETGFLVARGDTEDLAEKIHTLLEEPRRREAMGIAGRKRVDDNFDLRKNVARLVQLYGIDRTT